MHDTPSLQKYKRVWSLELDQYVMCILSVSIHSYSICNVWQIVDAWGGWSLFQALLQTPKGIATKHRASIANVAVKYALDQVMFDY